MGKAYSPDLAWRVVWQVMDAWHWDEYLPNWIVSPIAEGPLRVSTQYVRNVWNRYWWTGDVATHQGKRDAPPANQIWDVESDMALIQSLTDHPRWQLKDHFAGLVNMEDGKRVSYSTVCKAVWRLGFSRQKIRSICRTADEDRAVEWLADLISDYPLGDCVFLDETSKDLGVLKGSFGFALRGHGCCATDLPALTHGSRVSMLNIFSPWCGFLDHVFTDGTFNTELFTHVTTEPFVDHNGDLRRPILLDYVQAWGVKCVILDNASIHKDKLGRFEARLAAVGCEVRYQPAYCWWLSPLDNGAYGRIVTWMRASENATLVSSLPIRMVLEAAMAATIGEDEAWNTCRRCGYTREE